MEVQLNRLPKELLIQIILKQNLIEHINSENECREKIEELYSRVNNLRKKIRENVETEMKELALIKCDKCKSVNLYHDDDFDCREITLYFNYSSEVKEWVISFVYSFDFQNKKGEFIEAFHTEPKGRSIRLQSFSQISHIFPETLYDRVISENFINSLYS